MKLFISCLVLCAVLGLSKAQFQDSPAVAAAKAAHFEAVRRAENIIANGPPPPLTNNLNRKPVEETSQHKLGQNVHDTPEVAAAKAAHYDAVRDAEEATAIANSTAKYPESFEAGQNYQPPQHIPAIRSPTPVPSPTPRPVSFEYHPSPSVPIVQTTQHKLGVNVQETPEVAAARAAHFEALRRAEQLAALSGPVQYEDTYVMVPRYQNLAPIVPAAPVVRGAAVAGPRFIEQNGPYGQRAHQVMYVPQTYERNIEYYPSNINMIPVVAVPQTNQHKLGFNVQDTPEVAAAKKAHFEAFRQAQLVAAASVEDAEKENPAQRNNYFANPTRQYGQVNY